MKKKIEGQAEQVGRCVQTVFRPILSCWLRLTFLLDQLHNSSFKSKWQQVSSALRDFSQYSSRSQLFCHLVDYNSSLDFQFPQFLSQVFRNCSECSNYDWYYCLIHVPQLFQLSNNTGSRIRRWDFNRGGRNSFLSTCTRYHITLSHNEASVLGALHCHYFQVHLDPEW